jgi:hypothetical protein
MFGFVFKSGSKYAQLLLGNSDFNIEYHSITSQMQSCKHKSVHPGHLYQQDREMIV